MNSTKTSFGEFRSSVTWTLHCVFLQRCKLTYKQALRWLPLLQHNSPLSWTKPLVSFHRVRQETKSNMRNISQKRTILVLMTQFKLDHSPWPISLLYMFHKDQEFFKTEMDLFRYKMKYSCRFAIYVTII